MVKNPGLSHISENIFLYLDRQSTLSCQLVSQSWKAIVDQPHFWIKKCDQNGQPEDLHNAWIDLVKRIPNGSIQLEEDLNFCLLKWHKILTNPCCCRMTEEEVDGISPVHIASRFGHIEIVKFMASITPYLILKMYFNIPKTDGWAPIHLAARFGQTEVVKFFIDNCDIPKSAPGGRNIIHIGALNGK